MISTNQKTTRTDLPWSHLITNIDSKHDADSFAKAVLKFELKEYYRTVENAVVKHPSWQTFCDKAFNKARQLAFELNNAERSPVFMSSCIRKFALVHADRMLEKQESKLSSRPSEKALPRVKDHKDEIAVSIAKDDLV